MPARGIATSMRRKWSRSRGISMGGGLLVSWKGGLRGGRGLGVGRGRIVGVGEKEVEGEGAVWGWCRGAELVG